MAEGRAGSGRARKARWAWIGGIAAALLFAGPARADEAATVARIEALVTEARIDELRWPHFPDYREILAALYAPRAYAPLWLAGGRPVAPAADAVRALLGADALGLAAADYDAARLEGTRRGLASGAMATPESLARFDVALSVGFLRFVSDLHIGRVNPKQLSFGFDVGPKKFDLAARVADAVAGDRIDALVAEAPPALAQHRMLVEHLARYRSLAADPGVGPLAVSGTIRPGDPCAGAADLARWLGALGDLAAVPDPLPPVYEGVLVEAVQRFQARHGLEPDGVIGRATAGALAVPAEQRVRQIELALERLRWVPSLGAGRFVVVNIPAFELFAFEHAGEPGAPALSMRVVVGKAATRTPVFAGAIDSVVFAPYWNVPTSILRSETLPRVRRDPGYLARQDMEIVGGGLAELEAGSARVRQRPGPKNALGRVKFLFPNSHSVYLHDTPSRGLFARSRRDFSHGCIRVEKPVELAEWVLQGRADWPPARMREAMAGRRETPVRVEPPVPVVIFYATAMARPDGTISFVPDLYGYDEKLERALASGYPFS